jgi:DNA-binding PadR family transcriptional regulator
MSYSGGAKKKEGSRLWELALLCLLREGPAHPYDLLRTLRARRKDDVLLLKRGSLYHAVERLLGARLIEAVDTEREGKRPERTTYRITAAGEAAIPRWLAEMITSIRREPSRLMGAVSFLVYLPPGDAAALLQGRLDLLDQEVAALAATIEGALPIATRINLLESEYLLAVRRAEARWLRGLIEDIRGRRLSWDLQAILRGARAARRNRARA